MPKNYTNKHTAEARLAELPKLTYSTPEVAQMLSVSLNTVRRLLYSKQIISYRVGKLRLIDASDLKRFLAERKAG